MELPPFVTPNNLGLIGLMCDCEVDGSPRRAALKGFSAALYADQTEAVLAPLIEGDLRAALNSPTLKLLAFTATTVPDLE